MKSATYTFHKKKLSWNTASANGTSVELQRFDAFFVADCTGKVSYCSETVAREVMKRIAKRTKRRHAKSRVDGNGALVAYRCRHCGSWHIGRKAGK